MRRSIVSLVAVGWLLIPAVATADHGAESATGGGRTEGGFGTVASGSSSFNAREDAGGTRGTYKRVVRALEPSGEFETTFIRGTVDCLEVTGNTAVISGEVVRETVQFDPERFMVIAIDNGEPQDGMATDAFTEHFFFGASVTDPTTCLTTGPAGISILLLTRGNVIIHDDV